MAEYKPEFLRLTRYAQALVVSDYDKCVRFEEGLRYDLPLVLDNTLREGRGLTGL